MNNIEHGWSGIFEERVNGQKPRLVPKDDETF